MPRFCVIYVKATDKTPKKTTITFVFPNGQTIDYESDNVILKDFTKEYIVEKRLFPYIPFYIARYEKELTSENGIEAAVKDLEYFRNEMIRLHEAGELSDDEIVDLMGQEFGLDDAAILTRLQSKLKISEEAANAYLSQYGKTPV